MDLNDIWQEHKGFIVALLASVILFFALDGCIVGGKQDDAKKARAGLLRLRSTLSSRAIKEPLTKGGPMREGLYDDETLAVMTREVKREEQAYEAMRQACAFVPRETWNDTRMRFVLDDNAPEPSFTAAETARGLDDFWRRALATHWEGGSFTEHFKSVQARGSSGEGTELERYQEFLIGLDLADRVLQLAGHHRLIKIEVQGIGKRSRSGLGSAVPPPFLTYEVPVRFVVRASSIQARTFLQDLLAGKGEALQRNANGELTVAIETGGPAAQYRRVGEAWPLQVEDFEWEPVDEKDKGDSEATEVLRLSVVARVFQNGDGQEGGTAVSDEE